MRIVPAPTKMPILSGVPAPTKTSIEYPTTTPTHMPIISGVLASFLVFQNRRRCPSCREFWHQRKNLTVYPTKKPTEIPILTGVPVSTEEPTIPDVTEPAEMPTHSNEDQPTNSSAEAPSVPAPIAHTPADLPTTSSAFRILDSVSR